MGNVGRFFCVALPFVACVASLIALLVAGLAGVADKNLYMFQINTKNISLSADTLKSLASDLGKDVPNPKDIKLPGRDVAPRLLGEPLGTIHASTLGLGDLYDVSLWGYCVTDANNKRTCTKPAYNWAEAAFANTTNGLQTYAAAANAVGANVTIPTEIRDAMKAFSSVTRWTEIVFIAAYVLLALEILVGVFAQCSRAVSCVTWVVAGFATTAVCAAAALVTAMSTIVVGAVEASAKVYGVKADLNTRYLATVWIAAAFAIVAGFFWIFTVCCCKPERRSSKRHSDAHEKLIPGSYQPLGDPEHNGFQNRNNHASQYGAPRYPAGGRSDLAYEPYSHQR